MRDETVAVVVVTYNRADLLGPMLQALAAQTRPADAVVVVDNASTDHTAEVLAAASVPGLQVIRNTENTGGAGGFAAGMRAAHAQGFDRLWLMDDDVVPAPECLAVLMARPEDCLMAVREDRHGHLVEKAATRFDLRSPWSMNPKRSSVDRDFDTRAAMPEVVELHNVAFEGFMVSRRAVDAVGWPDARFFIFYDDAEYAVRLRHRGYRIWGVRDAVLVRQIDFDQQTALDTWKGFYMYRNLFVVHQRHGENVLVRLKPWLITLAVVVLSPLRGGRPEAANVIRAMRSARTFDRTRSQEQGGSGRAR